MHTAVRDQQPPTNGQRRNQRLVVLIEFSSFFPARRASRGVPRGCVSRKRKNGINRDNSHRRRRRRRRLCLPAVEIRHAGHASHLRACIMAGCIRKSYDFIVKVLIRIASARPDGGGCSRRKETNKKVVVMPPPAPKSADCRSCAR